jgi:hypothetical protein
MNESMQQTLQAFINDLKASDIPVKLTPKDLYGLLYVDGRSDPSIDVPYFTLNQLFELWTHLDTRIADLKRHQPPL